MRCPDPNNPVCQCVPYKIFGKFGPHDCKVVCAYCLKFKGWEQIKGLEDQRLQRTIIIDTLMKGEISEWERSFLKSIKTQNNLTDKQHTVFERIKGKYLAVPEATEPQALPTNTVYYEPLDNLF